MSPAFGRKPTKFSNIISLGPKVTSIRCPSTTGCRWEVKMRESPGLGLLYRKHEGVANHRKPDLKRKINNSTVLFISAGAPRCLLTRGWLCKFFVVLTDERAHPTESAAPQMQENPSPLKRSHAVFVKVCLARKTVGLPSKDTTKKRNIKTQKRKTTFTSSLTCCCCIWRRCTWRRTPYNKTFYHARQWRIRDHRLVRIIEKADRPYRPL